jgi:cellulose synthase/poly-beta-1,6-N-acetylglucosamine synthase-like glycosyltransferase
MYATKAVNGVPAIQRDGQRVLSVCDQDWEFANWLCALLNELGGKSELLLNERDREWLKAIDSPFRRAAQHANVKTVPTISIVVPFHNEEPNVIELYGRLQGVMEELGRTYQFVFVDDGSRDLTYKLLKELAEIDPHVVASGCVATLVRPQPSLPGLRIAMANT